MQVETIELRFYTPKNDATLRIKSTKANKTISAQSHRNLSPTGVVTLTNYGRWWRKTGQAVTL